jgi:hypothetical protein
MAQAFGHALALQVPDSRNVLLVARAGQAPQPATLASTRPGPERLNDADRAHWQQLLQTAANVAFWRDLSSGAPVLDDDRPVLDALLAASYVQRNDAAQAIACSGRVEVAGAEAIAYAARAVRDWSGVLAAAGSSATASAQLREWCGDARWGLRQLRAAAAEYRAGLALQPEPARPRSRPGGPATILRMSFWAVRFRSGVNRNVDLVPARLHGADERRLLAGVVPREAQALQRLGDLRGSVRPILARRLQHHAALSRHDALPGRCKEEFVPSVRVGNPHRGRPSGPLWLEVDANARGRGLAVDRHHAFGRGTHAGRAAADDDDRQGGNCPEPSTAIRP